MMQRGKIGFVIMRDDKLRRRWTICSELNFWRGGINWLCDNAWS